MVAVVVAVAGGCVVAGAAAVVVVAGGCVVVGAATVVVVVDVVEVVVVEASGSGRLNDGSDSRSLYCSGSLPSWPHTYTWSPRSTRPGNTSASELEIRMQPCEAGRVGTFFAPWMAMP